jgi:PadR family transcriptional regulator, regulatory protein PadR
MGTEPRMTGPTLEVLRVFADAPLEEHYGLGICEIAGLPGGTIYPILARLELAGWLESAWEDIDESKAGRRRRRFYRLTPNGIERARLAFDKVRQPSWQGLKPNPRSV